MEHLTPLSDHKEMELSSMISCYGIAANGPNDIAIQSDQKIIVLGSVITQTNGRDFAVIRYNTDGSLDTSFGLGGLQLINFIPAANTDNGSKVVIQPDGKIPVSGYSSCAQLRFVCCPT